MTFRRRSGRRRPRRRGEGDQATARSEAQRAASKRNGAKSRSGPTTPEEPQEGPVQSASSTASAPSTSSSRAWTPPTSRPSAAPTTTSGTPRPSPAAILVERLAVNAWRLNRATRADIAYRGVTADGSIAYAADAERRRRVDAAVGRIFEEPTAALADLESHAYGIDRLTTTWAELDRALEPGASGWDRKQLHGRLMMLHGRHELETPALIGPAGPASARLLAANTPGGAPLPADEAEAAVEEIRRVVVANLERLRALRARVQDPDELRRQMIAAAMVDETHGAQLRIRYEMAIERSIRSTIKQLMELKRTGADLNAPIEPDPEPEPAEPSPAAADRSGCLGSRPEAPVRAPSPGVSKRDPGHPATSSPQVLAAESVGAAPGSVGAGESRPSRRRPDPAKRLRESRQRAAKRPRKAGSNP